MAEVSALKALPPEEAIAYFRAKGFALAPSVAWQDLWQEAHATAFTVARSAGFDILADVHGAVQKALAEGRTFEQFQRELTPLLQAKGWWGRDAEGAQLGSPRRLQIIYDVNMRTARAAGHWAQIQRLKERRPYLRYVAILDGHTRPEHLQWHGLVLPVDDPFWLTHYPPNGWACRCRVQQLSEGDLKRLGYRVSPSPDIKTRPWVNPRTGETIDVPEGIDPGWGYNVGVAALESHAAQALNTKLIAAPPELAAAASAASAEFVVPALRKGFSGWVDTINDQVRAAEEEAQRTGKPGRIHATKERRVIGMLRQEMLDKLAAKALPPQSGAITVSDGDLIHFLRTAKTAVGKAPTADMVKMLPDILAQPKAILWDKDNQNFLYVSEIVPVGDRGLTRFAVAINRSEKLPKGNDGKRATIMTNSVVSASLVNAGDFSADRYERIFGEP